MEDRFQQGLEYEITQAQKKTGKMFGWLVTTSSKQLRKLNTSHIGILGELLQPIESNKDHLSREAATEKLIGTHHQGIKSQQNNRPNTLKNFLGGKNVAFVYYPRARPPLHSHIVNLDCLNAMVYKGHVRKSTRICRK